MPDPNPLLHDYRCTVFHSSRCTQSAGRVVKSTACITVICLHIKMHVSTRESMGDRVSGRRRRAEVKKESRWRAQLSAALTPPCHFMNKKAACIYIYSKCFPVKTKRAFVWGFVCVCSLDEDVSQRVRGSLYMWDLGEAAPLVCHPDVFGGVLFVLNLHVRVVWFEGPQRARTEQLTHASASVRACVRVSGRLAAKFCGFTEHEKAGVVPHGSCWTRASPCL